MELTRSYINNHQVIGAAIEVHKHLSPGLLENVYQKCREKELSLRELRIQSQLKMPLDYKGMAISTPMRCDLFVEDILPVELKAVTETILLNEAQLMTYMKLLEVPKGLMINFSTTNIYKQGQRTYVNEWYRTLPA